MANNLLDTIRQNSLGQQPQGVTGETGKLQTLLRAKSGRSVTGSEVNASSLGEESAVQQANNQLQQQVLPQASLQQQGLEQQAAGQEQQFQQQTAQVEQGRRFDDLQTKLKTDQLLGDLQRNKGQIDMNRDKAQMEQAGFQVRMGSKAYTDSLQREGNKARLGDATQFSEALTRDALGANKELLEKQLGNRSLLNANDNEFMKAIGKMDAATAYTMFRNEATAAKDKAQWGTATEGAKAGMGAYSTSQENAQKKEYYTTGGGQSDTSYEASKFRSGGK